MIWATGNGTFRHCAGCLKKFCPDAAFEDFEVTHEFEKIGRRTMLLNARRIHSEEDEEIEYILLAMEDITEGVSQGRAKKAEGKSAS